MAGFEQMHFVAHASVLEQSDNLKAVIHGKWKDSLEREIVLEDWDAATVGRVLQWLYTGDYKVPNPKVPFPLVKNHKQIARSAAATAQSPKPTLTPLANLRFNKLSPPTKRTEAETLESWMQRAGDVCYDMDYELTLMAHAKLYVLANYMLLPGLQAFTFERLQKLLSTMSPIKKDKSVISNVVTLIDYVHATTTRPDVGEESLQELITTFIALNFSQFNDGGGKVQRLMNQNRDFAEDVVDKVRRNMADIENKLEQSTTSSERVRRDMLDMEKEYEERADQRILSGCGNGSQIPSLASKKNPELGVSPATP